MWVVVTEPTPLAIHMDAPDNYNLQQRLAYSPSSSTTNTATPPPQRRKTRKSPRKATGSMRDVTCAPSLVLCRYANKKCTNPRALKRTGGLHTFCDVHRENANRNQRRLDLRKRLQKQALQSSALLDRRQGLLRSAQAIEHIGLTASSHLLYTQPLSLPQPLPLSIAQPHQHAQAHTDLSIAHSTDLLYEPLAAPTPLRDEDVTTLITLFASAEQLQEHDALCLDDVTLPREPRFDYMRDSRSD